MKFVDTKLEGQAARNWREASGLSRRVLSERTGFTEKGIARIEAGEWSEGVPIDPATLQLYRLACASVALGVAFDWHTLELSPQRVTIRIETEAENG